jgi:hypothetical protein
MLLICRDFGFAYTGALAVLVGLAVFLNKYIGSDMANVIGTVPVMVGAMFAGQHHGVRTGRRPGSGFSWLAAFIMVILATAIGIAALDWGLSLLAENRRVDPMQALDGVPLIWQVGFLTFLFAGFVLAARCFFRWGADAVTEPEERELASFY